MRALLSKTNKKRLLILASLSALWALVWGFVIEPQRLVVHTEDLALPGWPSEQKPLRVALVSDLHVGSPWWTLERLQQLVERVNAERPDVVLLAGDYTINGVKFGTKIPIEPIAKVLGGLRSAHGTIAILGNHDWYNDGDRTRAALEANGIVVLENKVHTFIHAGSPVNIAGLADLYERDAKPETTFAEAGAGPIIALIHEPDIFHGIRFKHTGVRAIGDRPAITLAGHTHGGQVRLPLFGRPVVPSDFGDRYAAGHIVEDGRHLFVTTGVGTSIYPVRFGVPPEIALLTLHGAERGK